MNITWTVFTIIIIFYFLSIWRSAALWSRAKQVITNLYSSLSTAYSGWNLSYYFEQGLRGKISQNLPYMLSAKQGSIWYNFIMSLVWSGQGSNPRLPVMGQTLPLSHLFGKERSTNKHPAYYYYSIVFLRL